MAMRGHRFALVTEDDFLASHKRVPSAGFGLVSDIKERDVPIAKAPSPPRPKGSSAGFPSHKDRQARFKRTRQGGRNSLQLSEIAVPQPQTLYRSNSNQNGSNHVDGNNAEETIDAENRQRLAEMSEDEKLQAKQDLLTGLSPSLVEKLLKKANIEDGEMGTGPILTSKDEASVPLFEMNSGKGITSNNQGHAHRPPFPAEELNPLPQTDLPPRQPPADLHPVSSKQPLPPLPEIHFPKRPMPPELDPNDPDFPTKLHSVYFPSLPSDPSALGWMAPVKEEEQASYSPSLESLPPSSLRFDFRGRLLPPRLSSQIPTSKGLHHHGHVPESAGYTVPELAHLAQSTLMSQRCIAYQTLGRILYRLGRGDFGKEGENLCEGLWELIEKSKVLQAIIDVASREDEGNRSLWATATDAVWLWRKGGGRRWKGR